MSKFWDLRQAAIPKTLDLFIYSDVEGDGYDWWYGETKPSETSAATFRDKLAAAGAVDQINLYINSLGGSVVEGTAIYNQLRRHPAQKTAYIDGFACSIASVIAMAANRVVMPRNTAMCIHNMMNIVMGNAKQLRKAADDLDVLMEANRQAYLQKAGDKLTESRLIEMLEAETWLTAEQCIGFGLADEFAAEEADLTQAKQMLESAKQKVLKQQYDKLIARAPLPEDPPPNPRQRTNAEKLRAAFHK
jgi:ATP-dependent protease ClpP protease subunit